MVPIPNFKQPKDMNKQYTTEEITRRLKAGERITAIDGCNMPNGKDALIIGRTYEVKEYFGGGDFEIESEEYKCHEFDAGTFSQFFMFTSDYEKMKSEEAKDTVKHGTLYDAPTEIPEWLQRERVRVWGNSYLVYTNFGSSLDKCVEYANKDLEQFDKRFLNQKETK